jgi:hypothetical protein
MKDVFAWIGEHPILSVILLLILLEGTVDIIKAFR